MGKGEERWKRGVGQDREEERESENNRRERRKDENRGEENTRGRGRRWGAQNGIGEKRRQGKVGIK